VAATATMRIGSLIGFEVRKTRHQRRATRATAGPELLRPTPAARSETSIRAALNNHIRSEPKILPQPTETLAIFGAGSLIPGYAATLSLPEFVGLTGSLGQ
jgi:hypothetical protein